MARYTLNLSEVCQVLTNTGTSNMQGNAFDYIDDIIEQSIPILFSNRIEIYDDNVERAALLHKIVEHYWEYEICTYTPNDFILRINRKLNEIMPYYNQLWHSTKIEFDPMIDTDYTTDHKSDAHDTTTEDNNQDQKHTGTDTDTAKHSGTDTKASTDGGKDTTTSTAIDNGTDNRDITTTADETGTNANLTPRHWRYNNDTPQNSISGITEQDYLTSYSAEKDDNRPVVHNGGAAGRDVNYQDANGGQLSDRQSKTIVNDDNEYSSTATGETTVDYGKNNTTSDTYDSQIKTDHDYDSNVNVKSDNLKNYIHDGKNLTKIKGKANGGRSYSELLNLYRQTMLNIDQQIIDDLKELFFIIR